MAPLAAAAGAVVALADATAADRLLGASPLRDGKHVVAVLADPSLHGALDAAAAHFEQTAGEPVRVDYVPSDQIADRVLQGEPIDVVVVVGQAAWHRVRPELDHPGQEVSPATYLGAVTDLGSALTQSLRRSLSWAAG